MPATDRIQDKVSNESHFRVDHLQTDIRRRSINGGTQTLIAQAAKVIVQMASMALFARLLSPEDYGLFGIVMGITAFGTIIRDMGLSTATIQTEVLSHSQSSTIFWVTISQSLLLALLTVATAPLVCAFFKDDRLFSLLAVMSSSYVIWAAGSQHLALLRRQMRYTALSYIEVSSVTLGVLIGVAAAFSGAKIWSLVYAQVAIASISTIGSWIACKWRPGLPARGTGVRPMLRFGQHLTGFSLLSYLNRNLDNLLIGRWCGTSVLGLYDRAYQIHMFPAMQVCWPVASVAIGALSRLRHEPNRFNEYSRTAVLLACTVSMPAIAYLFVKADLVVSLLLGNQWMESVPLLRALALAAFIDPILISFNWICVAGNQTSKLFRARVAQSILTVAAFLIGIRWGAMGVALAVSVTRLIVVIPTLLYCSKNTTFKKGELLAAPLPPAIAAAIAGVLVGIIRVGGDRTSQIIEIACSGIVFTLIYFSILILFPRSRRTLIALLDTLKPIRPAILDEHKT